MKHILPGILFSLTLLFLTACGGGGSGTPYTTATLKINLAGDLGAKAIAGISFILTLPAHVTPANVNNVVATGVVAPSGTFTGSSIAPIVTYLPPATTPGTMQIVMSNSVPAGVTTVGEVATITLQLTNRATPAAADFAVTSVNIIDTFGAPVSGVSASVAGVTLQ